MSNWNWRSGTKDIYDDEKYNIVQVPKEVLKTAPTQTIVSRAEAKTYDKLSSDTTDDSLIDQLIATAQACIEQHLGGVMLYHQTWTQYQQGGCETIELMKEPVIGVPTVSYYEKFDTVTATNITYTSHFRVLQDELYHADGYWEPGREGDGYKIEYDVGMFTASNYTSSNDPRLQVFKTAMERMITYLYENREEYVAQISEGNWSVTYSGGLPTGVKELIMPFRSVRGLI